MVVYAFSSSAVKSVKHVVPVLAKGKSTTSAPAERPTAAVFTAPSHVAPKSTVPVVTQPPSGVPARRPPSKEQLKHMRVVQRNLVYVIGLAPSVARDTLLERADYFGQYGRIVKLVVNKQVGYLSLDGPMRLTIAAPHVLALLLLPLLHAAGAAR